MKLKTAIVSASRKVKKYLGGSVFEKSFPRKFCQTEKLEDWILEQSGD